MISLKEYMTTIIENELSDRALDVAITAHINQTRKDGSPYIMHPVEVAKILREVKQSHRISELIAAAYLHDTVEDAPMKLETIKERFGDLVANLVGELTSDPKQIRKLGKTQYLINKMLTMSNWGLVIKLADRVHNTADLTNAPLEFRIKYRKETKNILKALKENRKLSITQQKLVKRIERNLINTLREL